MIGLFRREWGAITFVATVLIGAVVVGISFAIGAGGHGRRRALSSPRAPRTRPGRPPSAGATPTATPFAFSNCPPPPTEPLRA